MSNQICIWINPCCRQTLSPESASLPLIIQQRKALNAIEFFCYYCFSDTRAWIKHTPSATSADCFTYDNRASGRSEDKRKVMWAPIIWLMSADHNKNQHGLSWNKQQVKTSLQFLMLTETGGIQLWSYFETPRGKKESKRGHTQKFNWDFNKQSKCYWEENKCQRKTSSIHLTGPTPLVSWLHWTPRRQLQLKEATLPSEKASPPEHGTHDPTTARRDSTALIWSVTNKSMTAADGMCNYKSGSHAYKDAFINTDLST